MSLLTIGTKLIFSVVASRTKSSRHKTILIDVGNGDVPEEEETDSVAGLTLQKTASRTDQAAGDISKPAGETVMVGIEFVALLGQISIGILLLVLHDKSRHTEMLQVSIASLIAWGYIAALAATRLYFSAARQQSSVVRLWNHTACLYGAQWLFLVFVFRSALLNHHDRLSRNLTIASFTLTSLLTTIALVSRKGNREVLLEFDNEIEPSREPLASILSIISFSWADAIIWKGFKKPLELHDVWNLTAKDKAEAVLNHFRQVKKTHKLAIRLLLYFKEPILIQGAWCAIASVLMFLPTLLLKAILEYLEEPELQSVNAAWLYVVLLFVTGFVQAIGDGQSLWIGRKIGIRLRAVMIGEIYSKVLRRKAAATAETDLGGEEPQQPLTFWQRLKSWKRKAPKVEVGIKPTDIQINNGTIINLMSIDSFKVSEISGYLHFLWAAVPVQLFMAVTLLYKVLGLSSLVGIVLMILVLPLNLFIAKSFQRAQKRIMAATDKRIQVTNEVLQNVRIIKYFAWERRFAANVNEKRQQELSALWRKYVLWSGAATVWSGIPILITFASFLVFTLIEKKRLVPSIAFPALSMFSLLRVPLDQLADMVAHVQESKVSVDRVEQFLSEEETEKYKQLRSSQKASPQASRITLREATLAWGSPTGEGSDDNAANFRLINMNVDFEIGKLNVIAGPTGSGKTSLLMALLGEMKLLSGQVCIPGGYSRQDLRPDPHTGLTESVAYCAQQAWLVNATIKENILFASPFDANRYEAVIVASALGRDLEILDAGDQTLVGEKGITLSGGQKQRISLARALYSNSKHLLLDDCLSAVDSHTAKHIFEHAISGNLMLHRTCILVSHNVALTVPQASLVVVLANGKIVTQGTPNKVIESGVLGDEILKSRPSSTLQSAAPSRTPSNLEQLVADQQANGHTNGGLTPSKKPEKKVIDTRIEAKATGSVKFSTIKMYLLSMGPWYYWVGATIGFMAVQIGSIATNVWIREWANAYSTRRASTTIHSGLYQQPLSRAHAILGGQIIYSPLSLVNSTSVGSETAPNDVDAGYYLGIYALLGLAYILICFARELILFWGSLRASWKFHEQLLQSILRATFRFFDSTPLGQLNNRFSKDIQSIDQEVAPVAIGMFHSAAAVVSIVILIAAITPGFLIPGFFIACLYTATGLLYIRSSRDLKRIEAVQRSPLFQHFGETLSGVVTIRAYGDEARFVQDNHNRVNTHNRPFLYLWATNRWLAFRIEVAGALVSFFSATFIMLNVGKIDAGAAGLSLTYAITFTQNVLWLVRLYAANEQNMNAVERVQEYIDVDQEAAANVPEMRPPRSWPSHGAIQFEEYSTRYRKDLDPVLRQLSFRIQAGEKVGIVGRTGAGKSSLALALFRGLEAENGKILIDGVEIGNIGLQDLREAITIVPQDPTLFTGTLRSNLDPFGLFTDEEVFTALRRVQLISSSHEPDQPESGKSTPTDNESNTNANASNGQGSLSSTTFSDSTLVQFASNVKDSNKNIFLNLSSPIAESGSNLSQGQRQLLCLARALLKSPKVLVMDEATASIDYATDSKIQDTLRELKDNTIITIAHRLQTIIDYDKVLVLDKGEIIEYADPYELIRKEDGMFRGMCETSGELEHLTTLARKAWEDRRLIDDE